MPTVLNTSMTHACYADEGGAVADRDFSRKHGSLELEEDRADGEKSHHT